ncbi:E3 ubiquitin-protein ligase RNF4-like [Rhineura floridana]|uniref:E3 ubiquitin-protein ligase RNF4-like n=1 Tax=Rhineura floridana TaxID=261503 RepID=UPI002AC82077|nr:E3 ubiquitin-protein ligase RNF4-like [Rhineura floridana]
MSSANAKRDGTKCRKNKRDTGLIPARPHSDLGKMVVGAASEPRILPPFLLSTSSMALPLHAATAGSSPNAGPSFLEPTAPLSDRKETEQEAIQRVHCGDKTHSMQTRRQSRMAASAAEVDPVGLDDGSVDKEIIDLTCESSEPVVIDLTHNDSVVFVGNGQWQNQELRSQPLSDSCILSSGGDGSRHTESEVLVASKLPRELGEEGFASSRSLGIVSCPICMESYAEIVHGGRLIVSTKCGRIFCSQCLRDSLRHASSCPTCRKKLSQKQYHPIYI